ncbi:hypothetical protein [Ottowia sp.]|uniref:hypothetical protein n=1 Tax=Ottowia sp. TaxID=1898956 RepID=UPI0039E4957F
MLQLRSYPALTLGRAAARWLAAAGLLAASFAHADYLWLQRDGAQMQVRAGELLKPVQALPALVQARPVLPGGKPAPAHEQSADRYSFAADAGDARFTAVRAGPDGVLTYFHARFGRQETQAVNDLELVPTAPGGNTFRLVFKGRTVPAGQVNVETAEGWRRMLKPAEDGTVSFTPWFPGLYVLEVAAKVDDGNATLGGKTYKDVRHVTTLSFEVAPR